MGQQQSRATAAATALHNFPSDPPGGPCSTSCPACSTSSWSQSKIVSAQFQGKGGGGAGRLAQIEDEVQAGAGALDPPAHNMPASFLQCCPPALHLPPPHLPPRPAPHRHPRRRHPPIRCAMTIRVRRLSPKRVHSRTACAGGGGHRRADGRCTRGVGHRQCCLKNALFACSHSASACPWWCWARGVAFAFQRSPLTLWISSSVAPSTLAVHSSRASTAASWVRQEAGKSEVVHSSSASTAASRGGATKRCTR